MGPDGVGSQEHRLAPVNWWKECSRAICNLDDRHAAKSRDENPRPFSCSGKFRLECLSWCPKAFPYNLHPMSVLGMLRWKLPSPLILLVLLTSWSTTLKHDMDTSSKEKKLFMRIFSFHGWVWKCCFFSRISRVPIIDRWGSPVSWSIQWTWRGNQCPETRRSHTWLAIFTRGSLHIPLIFFSTQSTTHQFYFISWQLDQTPAYI